VFRHKTGVTVSTQYRCYKWPYCTSV